MIIKERNDCNKIVFVIFIDCSKNENKTEKGITRKILVIYHTSTFLSSRIIVAISLEYCFAASLLYLQPPL